MKVHPTLSHLTIVLTTLVTTLLSSAAYAAGPNDGDFFGRTTAPPTNPSTSVRIPATTAKQEYHYGTKPGQKWFAALDAQVGSHLVTEQELTVLSNGYGNPPQLERVIEWTNTAAGLAKKYRALAKILRSMPIPEEVTEDSVGGIRADFFLNKMAQNYEDQAAVLEEYIKPRRAARTKEELEEQLARVHDQSVTVKNSATHIAMMDTKLRSHFVVPPPRYRDALWSYVSQKPQ